MSREDLIESVEKLRRQVAKLSAGDSNEQLEHILSDLERQLEDPESTDPEDNLAEKLGQAVGHFEIEHPRLTEALNRVMVTLSNIGL